MTTSAAGVAAAAGAPAPVGAAAPSRGSLDAPVSALHGVGPRRLADLEAVGIRTIEDLLLSLPRRYEDRAPVRSIATLERGTSATVAGRVVSCRLRRTRRPGFTLVEVTIEDDTGRARATFMNQTHMASFFRPGRRVALHGLYDRGRGGLEFTNPDHEPLTDATEGTDDEDEAPYGSGKTPEPDSLHTGRIVPVYPAAGTCTSRMRRRWAHDALARLPSKPGDDAPSDPLPEEIRRRHGFPPRDEALRSAHFPPAGTSLETLNAFRTPAQQRLVYEEFFEFQVDLVRRRRLAARRASSRPLLIDDRIRRAARELLPFRLTGDQRTALASIADDLRSSAPMRRLLQGDVGSGKTIVAVLAALIAMENGRQVALMSPTEVLAEQQYANVARLLAPSHFSPLLLTGALTPTARREAAANIANGSTRFVVGTHALVQDDVAFRDLSLGIVDEQHRFGVMQRAALAAKGFHPNLLVMTATPIPRTLAMSAYGDLDVSELRERPPGRQSVTTHVWTMSRRNEAYERVRAELSSGRQAFVVHPLVDESETLDLRGATALARELDTIVFPKHRVGLVHGGLPSVGRQETMTAFSAGAIDVLVATTVVEVGVDVPNATIMVIEQAERFGLAQLHQLRGRVGRGEAASTCILLHAPEAGERALARLEVLAETSDGFAIAERDLELRGPGDLLGTRQSGLPFFRIGDVVRDHRLMADAHQAAAAWVAAAGAGKAGAPPDADHLG
ncbi:MAG: ATP-dependent DNA helicase RecG [Acidobacteria bacterium]|nr:ATP-dependent DNA helicase RecG [Acidobacteriota bacterium]